MKFSISVSTLIANLIDPTFETNLNKKKKNDLFIPIKPNYSTYSKYIYTHRFFIFVKPPFGFHRDKITLTTSQLKKKKKRKKKTKEQHTIAYKNSTSAICMRKFDFTDVPLLEILPHSSKTRRTNGMVRDFSERRIGWNWNEREEKKRAIRVEKTGTSTFHPRVSIRLDR